MKYNMSTTDMKYNCLISAIPKYWKQAILQSQQSEMLQQEFPNLYHLKSINKDIRLVLNRDVYKYLVKCCVSHPSPQSKWIENYPFLETLNWSTIYVISKNCIIESRLQSFQYSIINRYINCNYNLHLWNIVDSPACKTCNQIDTIEHYFFYCPDAKQFWARFSNMLHYTINYDHIFTVLEILLGIPCDKHTVLSLINLVIVLGKWFIHQCRMSEKMICFLEFISFLKRKIELLTLIDSLKEHKNDLFTEICQSLLDNL